MASASTERQPRGRRRMSTEREPAPGPGDPADEMLPSVRTAIGELGISATVIACDPNLPDSRAFGEQHGMPLHRIANTILLASRRGGERCGVFVVPADARLDVNGRAKRLMGASKVSFASHDQTHELTGMELGSVSPFGLPAGLAIFVDERVLSNSFVVVGSGVRRSRLQIPSSAFRLIPEAELVTGLSLPVEEDDRAL